MLTHTNRFPSLICEMNNKCLNPVSHIDDKGYIYCYHHGMVRFRGGTNVRRLTQTELETLAAGKTISWEQQ